MSDFDVNKVEGKNEQEITDMVNDMTNSDLKVILSVARPNGLDAGDPVIACAMERVNSDPGLKEWFLEMQKWDEQVAESLGSIMPPAGLKDRILAIGEAQFTASQDAPEVVGSQKSVRKTPWFAMAAAAVLMVGGLFYISEYLNDGTIDGPGGDGEIAGDVTPINGATAEFASWQADAMSKVDQILAGKLDSLPVPDSQVAWSWIDQQVPPATDDASAKTPGKTIGDHIAKGEGVACLKVERPDEENYALFCFKFDGKLSHVAVFDGVRDIPSANEAGVAVVQKDRWQTVSWVEEGRTMMLFFFTKDTENPTEWAEELMGIKLAAR